MKKWYGSVLIISVILLGIGGYVLFKGKETTQVFNEENKEETVVDDSSSHSTKAVIDTTISSEEMKIIKDQHEFYNDTAGWGAIDSLEWKRQKDNAEALVKLMSLTERSIKLESDFTRIVELSTLVAEGEKDKKLILYLHRIFHDLDMEVNGYRSKDYFEVTEIGEGSKTDIVTTLIEKKKGL